MEKTKSIIIKNLPKHVYVSDLCDKFRCFGSIISATIHCEDNKPSGSAYVEFVDSFCALKAVKLSNNTKMGTKVLQVSLSSENEHFKKIFVKNFNPEWDVCDLLQAFEAAGSIDTVNIFESNGKSNGYGYVIFNNHAAAKEAIKYMNGREVDGHKLVVERFQKKAERDALKENSIEYVEKQLQNSIQWNNLYIKNLPVGLTEDELEEKFQNFGEITSVKIAVDENGTSKGYGFVCFERKEDAKRALDKMTGYPLKGKRIQISFKEDGQIRRKYLALKNKEKDVKIRQYKERSRSVPKLFSQPLLGLASPGYFKG